MMSIWWERVVDLTILGYSYQICSIFDCFGIQNNDDKSTESILKSQDE